MSNHHSNDPSSTNSTKNTSDINKLISQMTLEEKASLCSGLDFWHTQPIERLDIPAVMVTDGPHGLRKQGGSGDHLGLGDSVPATCFPTAAGLASSWNRELLHQVGEAIGQEAQAEQVAIVLGPGTNIKRSPLCGRNFEYFSEDPYLSSELAASHIQGVQSQDVGTSLKHFAANNQEERRMSVDTIVDERTLREIYLASFEGAVKQGKPWTVMCSYNKLNGTYTGENEYLLTDILRREWGFEGFVVSDWGAVNERVDALKAGLELEMPANGGIGDAKIVAAVKDGKLDEKILDRAVEQLLRFVFNAIELQKPNATFDPNEHHQLARYVAAESMVLLKNDHNLLPLSKKGRVAVIGEFAVQPRYQGSGSSHINPTQLDQALNEIRKLVDSESEVTYAPGYDLDSDDVKDELVQEAVKLAGEADVVILFTGLPDRYESEGYDRTHLELPLNHKQLIKELAAVQPNLVVVLSNGSTVTMPWLDQTSAVLEGYLGGQAGGGAVADLLFGEVNPSGKLPETFPVQLSDNPSFLNFPGEGDRVEYREGIFVGYRYYDTKQLEPLFPFGYGLSYTSFEYSELQIDRTSMTDQDTVNVQVTVRNTGSRRGQEIVQLYVHDSESSVIRPEQELKGFAKVALEPGESKTVSFTLDKRAFAYYHTELHDWHVETGEYELRIGASSRDIRLKQTIEVTSTVKLKQVFHRNTTIGDIAANPATKPIAEELTKRSGLNDMMGDNPDMLLAMTRFMPLRAMINFGQGKYTEDMLEQDLQRLNEALQQAGH
ncbi:glycoside hydrolase family 3 C-terminal domain-containing protein [Paenibacillus hunanensis]|uniref:glycoside hydrolase family 3 C-terminal domain-containing protein n=1 Tax=Paenibacillus hunanensis TaxID=539262 RepID=UPI0020265022|nr:glycoside hydrolase family 3 C-terminal domain-containing protein [Paenibacillus hunanensis]MCL9660457.1 glycoside hydrolase family 3 C-terminal domain-containing protein [Paenibacillus hunanensis]